MKKPNLPTVNKKRKGDKFLFLAIISLLIFGIIVVYDVSIVYAHDVFGGKYYFLILQSIWVILGLIGFLIGYKVDYHKFEKFAFPIFLIALVTLIVVILPTAFSPKIYGARRWLYLNPEPFPKLPILGRIGFQPSEFFKLSFILYLALFFSKREKSSIISFGLLLLVSVGLVMLQPDFGTAMLVSGIAIIMYFISGANILHFILGLPSAIFGALLLMFATPHSRARIQTYLNPGVSDLSGAGYHINQILIALGSGGLFGLGFGQSRQKYDYLPEVATDSIFAVIGEELGFIGLCALISVFLFIIFRGFKIAKHAPDRFGRFLATGLISWFAIQCIVNLSAMVHLIPLTGVPLPLISYGGSSMIFGLSGLGILLNVSRYSDSS